MLVLDKPLHKQLMGHSHPLILISVIKTDSQHLMLEQLGLSIAFNMFNNREQDLVMQPRVEMLHSLHTIWATCQLFYKLQMFWSREQVRKCLSGFFSTKGLIDPTLKPNW